MAQRSVVHRISIELCDTDRQVYEDLQMSVARADSETLHRLVTRLLAYALLWERDIAFGAGVGTGDEPDVWVREPDGRVKTWIDVGLPDPKRLAKAARHCGRVVLFAYGKNLPRWSDEAAPVLEKSDNVTVVALDYAFVDRLTTTVDRTIAWKLAVSGGVLYLTSGKDELEGTVKHVSGPVLFG